MKKIYTLFVTLIFAGCLMAQVPQSFKYQAVARDVSGNIVADQAVGMRISILQGSISGTAVYVETFLPTTNGFGLINLNIGEGTVVSGDFTTIDWSGDIYFIKVEMDITGGTAYEEFGTSQLLSVPYAMHAETAESVTEAIIETDPVFGASQAANITATDITNLGNLSGTNTGDQDLSNLALKSNVLELDNTTTFTPDADYEPATKKYVDDNTSTTYSVGDFALGGIVFWLDETGQHGLVCAKEDQSSSMRWDAGTYGDTRAYGNHINAGKMNTDIIIGSFSGIIGDDGSPFAAEICKDLTLDGKSDWYLPSKEELNLMYQNKSTINATATLNGGSGFAIDDYWSSTEYHGIGAWEQYFGSGGDQSASGKNDTGYVRAVRAF